LPGSRIVASMAAIVLIVIFFVFMRKTWRGRMLQATAQNRFAAEIIGIKVERMAALAFALGAAFAAAAGIFLTPIYTVYPTAGEIPISKGFVVMVFAGLGSIMTNIVAGITLGLAETLAAFFFLPQYKSIYLFIFLMLILAVRPSGLRGEKARAV